uniref:Extensin n=1 Tax=Solanum tuberosum TaxID=4113 RepID=M1C6G1_SOLTU
MGFYYSFSGCHYPKIRRSFSNPKPPFILLDFPVKLPFLTKPPALLERPPNQPPNDPKTPLFLSSPPHQTTTITRKPPGSPKTPFSPLLQPDPPPNHPRLQPKTPVSLSSSSFEELEHNEQPPNQTANPTGNNLRKHQKTTPKQQQRPIPFLFPFHDSSSIFCRSPTETHELVTTPERQRTSKITPVSSKQKDNRPSSDREQPMKSICKSGRKTYLR